MPVIPNAHDESQPLYRRIYDYLSEEISSGRLGSGDRVPSEKELCERFGVSRITAQKALELLAEEGAISRFPGKGSFVSDQGAKGGAVAPLPAQAIGFLIPSFSDAFGTALVCSIEEACAKLGYFLILKRTRESAAEEAAAIEELKAAGVAGILLLPVHGEYYNPQILRLILEKKPLVFVDRAMRGLAAPSVSTDNVAAAKDGVDYLLGLGHKSIAFYSGTTEHSSTIEDRKTGFVRAFLDRGIAVDPELFCMRLESTWAFPYDKLSVDKDIETIRAHLSAHPELSAAFATEYSMALIIQSAARSLGRRMPEDLSILCFDTPTSIVQPPDFSCIRQDEYEMGRQAVKLLHEIIEGSGSSATPDIRLGAKLIQGRSTAPRT
jgi:GntR family transcriptional regulator, arabinose operon transcriptional repressor